MITIKRKKAAAKPLIKVAQLREMKMEDRVAQLERNVNHLIQLTMRKESEDLGESMIRNNLVLSDEPPF